MGDKPLVQGDGFGRAILKRENEGLGQEKAGGVDVARSLRLIGGLRVEGDKPGQVMIGMGL